MKQWIKYLGSGLVTAGIIVALFALRQSNNDALAALPSPPLKTMAQKHTLQLGNFAILKLLNDPEYREILTTQFDLATIDNVPNWHFVDHDLRPSPTEYDYRDIDKVVAFAKAHDMPMQAHHFLWGEEKWLPDWLLKGNYNEQQILDLMQDHILTVGRHYSGVIQQWTVVNEAFTRGQHYFGLHDWWADHTGGNPTKPNGYIDQAFLWARAADPNATLILNDFHNEGKNDISDAMFDYVKGAKTRGVPIDAVGFQMHIDGTHPPDKDEVISNMRRFGDIGVRVYVTEFDVNMNDLPVDNAAKDQLEATIYHDMLRACIESKNCPSFALLGITDKETWYNYLGVGNARPLPFDTNYDPKPAYFAMRRALEEN